MKKEDVCYTLKEAKAHPGACWGLLLWNTGKQQFCVTDSFHYNDWPALLLQGIMCNDFSNQPLVNRVTDNKHNITYWLTFLVTLTEASELFT